MSRVQARLALLAAAAVIAIAAGAVVAMTTGGGGPGGQASGAAQSGRHAPDGASAGAGRPLVPAKGAYLGAYVQPALYTPSGYISAFAHFEHQIHHSLALVHSYHSWAQPFPSASDAYFARHGKVLLLSWGGYPNTRAIVAGRDDAMIRARARALKALHRPVLLEFRHEMDRPNLQWTIHGPAGYIAAWDHIRAIFTAVGATNVSWVFCPTGYGFQVGRAAAFYPGSREVNWVCADIYAVTPGEPLARAARPFLRWAASAHKPILIGEFGVAGPRAHWPAWLAAAGRLAKSDPQVKAMAYFDANGTDSTGQRFRYRLSHDPRALAAFGRLASERYFNPFIPGHP